MDGSAFLQPGQASVGVKRPDGGAVGTRAHGQAGVSVGDARRQGAPVLERRRSLPPAWGEDEAYAERRRRGGVPPPVTVQPKPRLGWERLQAVPRAGTLRARWVAGDEACGRAPTRLDPIAGLGLWSLAEVPHDTPGWRQRPATAGPAWGGRGRQPTRARVVAGAPTPQTGGMVAESWPAEAWARHRIERRQPGPHRGRWGGPARHRPAGGLARPRGLAGAAAPPGDGSAADLPVERASGHAGGDPGAAEREAVAHRDVWRGRQAVSGDGR